MHCIKVGLEPRTFKADIQLRKGPAQDERTNFCKEPLHFVNSATTSFIASALTDDLSTSFMMKIAET